MAVIDSEIDVLSDTLITEIVKVSGLPETTAVQRLFRRIFHPATDRLATVGVITDRLITREGFSAAAKWMVGNWCRPAVTHGLENIPGEGPLLVLSNHAGTYDSVILSSTVGREDLKIVSNSIPFLMRLPHIAEHLIFVSEQTAKRAAGAYAAIRQLRKGGAVLMFGGGRLEPDPDVYPNAGEFIEKWSNSIALFLQSVPQARLIISIISGVLSRRWVNHPVTWLKRYEFQKRRLAIFGQVLQQLFSPGAFYLTPRISFSAPLTLDMLKNGNGSDSLLPAIIERGKEQLVEHMKWERNELGISSEAQLENSNGK